MPKPPALDETKAQALYDAGCPDLEIAHECRVSPYLIQHWRGRNGLAGNGMKGGLHSRKRKYEKHIPYEDYPVLNEATGERASLPGEFMGKRREEKRTVKLCPTGFAIGYAPSKNVREVE